MFGKFKNNENGDILILFAATLIVVLIFLGLSTDFLLAFNKRDKLVEIGKLIGEARVDLGEELWNSENPELLLKEIAWEIGKRNGLEREQVDAKWRVIRESNSYRVVNTSIELNDVYECSVLKIFGINELPMNVRMSGGPYVVG